MNNEIVKHAAAQAFKIMVFIGFIALFIGMCIGFYMLDHYRWGGCK